MTVEVTMQTREDGTLEVLSPFHWWCRECGRWEVCDEQDRWRECGWMRRRRQRGLAGAVAPSRGTAGQRAS